jgi:hypothetical protein
MKSSPFPALLVIFAGFAATPVAAQQRVNAPEQAPHLVNPSISPLAPSTSPLQRAQLILDYDAILIRKQQDHDLQQQDQSDPQRLRNERDRDLQQRNQSDPQRRTGY